MLVSPGRAATPITTCASCSVNDNSVRCDPQANALSGGHKDNPSLHLCPGRTVNSPSLHSQKCVLFHTHKKKSELPLAASAHFSFSLSSTSHEAILSSPPRCRWEAEALPVSPEFISPHSEPGAQQASDTSPAKLNQM